MVEEWRRRGYADTTRSLIAEFAHPDGPPAAAELPALLPPWWGDDGVHRSHRAALLRKDPGHDGAAFGPEPDDLPYVWPDPPAPAPTPRPRSAWVGRVTGSYRRSSGRHRRPVAWLTDVGRGDLRFPAGLQDPQVVFALRGEPLLDGLAAPR